MIKLLNILKENSTSTYSYGCVMLYFDLPQIKEIHDLISKDDIYTEVGDNTYGLEDEPHITLLYGLHEEVSKDDVKNLLKNHTFGDVLIHNVSLFENEKYDVLKFDVRYPTKGGAFLHKANTDLKQFPHTTSYPDYHPHLTIGYINPGVGKKYVKIFKNLEYKLKPKHVIYSHAAGTYDKIKINTK